VQTLHGCLWSENTRKVGIADTITSSPQLGPRGLLDRAKNARQVTTANITVFFCFINGESVNVSVTPLDWSKSNQKYKLVVVLCRVRAMRLSIRFVTGAVHQHLSPVRTCMYWLTTLTGSWFPCWMKLRGDPLIKNIFWIKYIYLFPGAWKQSNFQCVMSPMMLQCSCVLSSYLHQMVVSVAWKHP
jgi:hypothetical protein